MTITAWSVDAVVVGKDIKINRKDLIVITKLGDKVRDLVTGCEGIVICRTEYLNGCIRVGVTPSTLKDGVPHETLYFDEPQLEIVESEKIRVHGQLLTDDDSKPKKTGGPRPDPPKR